MAVMDMIEKEGANPSSTDEADKENVRGGSHSSAIDKSNNNNPTATASTVIVAPELDNSRLSKGPSPEKGSGQDRFRQMMMNAPGFTSTSGPLASYAMAPAPAHGRAPPTSMTHYSTGSSVPSRPVSTAVSTAYPHAPGLSRLLSMPTQVKTEGAKPDGSGNGTGRVANAGDDWRPSAPSSTAILSTECQKRRFNPQFTEWVTRDGRYMCSVNLNGITLHDSRTFGTALEAKQSLAKRAVAEVKKFPCPDPAARAAEKAAKASAWEGSKNEVPQSGRYGGQVNSKPHDDRRSHFAIPQGTDPIRNHYTTDPYTRRSEASHLVSRIQALYEGSGIGPSSFVLTDPLASRAFLEGFALGGRLHETANRPCQPEQIRPRSPQAAIDRLYARYQRERERSPKATIRRYLRERSPVRRLSFDG
ncbi:hypothetical protein DL764_004770 [Monosporascus ibericus]|uniref:Uncharacterized protein n=1 Tax=Monosporascus ibericus TaxID=155417 RepID=A0A4Q4TBC8_9PEZI|nr:hypothetical protein DL764_004770 [Monosporascus ibericus]